ncbi:MAG: hypothetical protein QOK36_3235 [Gaiellales bacterium]|nr:hypothetical protein [Gaiellales bacterium]
MHSPAASTRLSGLVLAGIVVAILAAGLARGQDNWQAALVLVGALLEITAIGYATRRVWLSLLVTRRVPRADEPQKDAPLPPAGDRAGQIPLFMLTPDEALIAGAMAIAGIVVSAVGTLMA